MNRSVEQSALEHVGTNAEKDPLLRKKWPLRGAAKFREETPRKGGGFAIKDRYTALQQYAEMNFCTQASKHTLASFTPRKSSKNTDIALNHRQFFHSATFCAVQNKPVFQAFPARCGTVTAESLRCRARATKESREAAIWRLEQGLEMPRDRDCLV